MSQPCHPSLPLDTALAAHLTATLRTLRMLRAKQPQWDRRASGSIGAVQSLIEALGRSPQLSEEQQLMLKDIRSAWDEALWDKKQGGQQ